MYNTIRVTHKTFFMAFEKSQIISFFKLFNRLAIMFKILSSRRCSLLLCYESSKNLFWKYYFSFNFKSGIKIFLIYLNCLYKFLLSLYFKFNSVQFLLIIHYIVEVCYFAFNTILYKIFKIALDKLKLNSHIATQHNICVVYL